MANEVAVTKRKRERSPNYPGLDLETAIEKARTLYRAEGRHSAPIDIILQHWGYSTKSSSGGSALAAVKQFGLLLDEGSGKGRKARISDDAYSIIVDEIPNSPERLRLIQKAALTPSIYKEFWEQYADKLPSDPNLKVNLRRRAVPFTETAATECINLYRKTLDYARLSGSAILSEREGENPPSEGVPKVTPPLGVLAPENPSSKADEKPKSEKYLYRLSKSLVAEVTYIGSAISIEDLERLKRYIDLEKEALGDQKPA